MQALEELLESDAKYGFIVMDGNGSLFGTLSGNTREILHKFTVDLPKKHGRGGQSALRFARLRLEKRHNYVRKVAETAVQMFITDGQRPNVAGLVVAGSAEFKDKLVDSEMFDPRLKAIVLCMCDVSYGVLLLHSVHVDVTCGHCWHRCLCVCVHHVNVVHVKLGAVRRAQVFYLCA